MYPITFNAPTVEPPRRYAVFGMRLAGMVGKVPSLGHVEEATVLLTVRHSEEIAVNVAWRHAVFGREGFARWAQVEVVDKPWIDEATRAFTGPIIYLVTVSHRVPGAPA